jgi:hypothetical protein
MKRTILTSIAVAAAVGAMAAQAANTPVDRSSSAPPAGRMCGVSIFVRPGGTADTPVVEVYPVSAVVCPVGAQLVFALWNYTDVDQTVQVVDFTHVPTGRKLEPRDQPGAHPTVRRQEFGIRRDRIRSDSAFNCAPTNQSDCGDYKYTIVVGKTIVDPGLQVTPPPSAPAPAPLNHP